MFNWFWRLRPLSTQQKRILQAVRQGWTLKSHRYLDGTKMYCLHALSGETIPVPAAAVQGLQRRGFLQSNQKFPAATFLLTDPGRATAEKLSPDDAGFPLTARNFKQNQ